MSETNKDCPNQCRLCFEKCVSYYKARDLSLKLSRQTSMPHVRRILFEVGGAFYLNHMHHDNLPKLIERLRKETKGYEGVGPWPQKITVS